MKPPPFDLRAPPVDNGCVPSKDNNRRDHEDQNRRRKLRIHHTVSDTARRGDRIMFLAGVAFGFIAGALAATIEHTRKDN